MTTNPFSGIITSGFKNLFNNAIDALLEDAACTVPCEFSYGITKYDNCSNCVFDPIGKKSSNRHLAGGPIPFGNNQQCPMCNGAGKIAHIATESINLMVIFDYKKFLTMNVPNLQSPEGMVQTLCAVTLTPKIKKVNFVIFDTDIEGYAKQKFTRAAEPEPCGLGSNNYVITLWKRTG